jgi:hypothetical protein
MSMTLENMSFEELVTTAKNLQKQYSGIENENILLKSQKTSLESKIDRMHLPQSNIIYPGLKPENTALYGHEIKHVCLSELNWSY